MRGCAAPPPIDLRAAEAPLSGRRMWRVPVCLCGRCADIWPRVAAATEISPPLTNHVVMFVLMLCGICGKDQGKDISKVESPGGKCALARKKEQAGRRGEERR